MLGNSLKAFVLFLSVFPSLSFSSSLRVENWWVFFFLFFSQASLRKPVRCLTRDSRVKQRGERGRIQINEFQRLSASRGKTQRSEWGNWRMRACRTEREREAKIRRRQTHTEERKTARRGCLIPSHKASSAQTSLFSFLFFTFPVSATLSLLYAPHCHCVSTLTTGLRTLKGIRRHDFVVAEYLLSLV